MKDGGMELMSQGSAAGCVAASSAPRIEIEGKARTMVRRVQSAPWLRVIVDAVLVAAILLASSSILVR